MSDDFSKHPLAQMILPIYEAQSIFMGCVVGILEGRGVVEIGTFANALEAAAQEAGGAQDYLLTFAQSLRQQTERPHLSVIQGDKQPDTPE